MTIVLLSPRIPLLILLSVIVLNLSSQAHANDSSEWLPTNQIITPTKAPQSTLTPVVTPVADQTRPIGQITRAILSPDGTSFIALSSGFNRTFNSNGQIDASLSSEVALVYQLTPHGATWVQTIELPNTFNGITFNEDGSKLFISGGKDDVIYTFFKDHQKWVSDGSAISLNSGPSLSLDLSLHTDGVGSLAAGIASIRNGQQALVSLYEHDALALVDTVNRTVLQRLDLRPGKSDSTLTGNPGGEYPADVVSVDDHTAFVASIRDREIVVINLEPRLSVKQRLRLSGQPTRLLLDQSRNHLFVTLDNSDEVWVYDTHTLKRIMKASTRLAPLIGLGSGKPGATPNNMTLSRDEHTLYVTNAGDNSLAVFHIDWREHELEPLGAIPTGWYPSAIVADSQSRLFVFNAKSSSGPNPDNCKATLNHNSRASACPAEGSSRGKNQYGLQLIHSSLLTLPTPNAQQLSSLTQQVADNNGYHASLSSEERHTIQFLQQHIHHIIYVVRENRTFDQILGDVPGVEGDPTRTQFGKLVTPNAHKLATAFSTLDHYYCSGDVSMNGWQWSTAARVSDINEKTTFLNYAKRGGSYDSEGGSRNINMAIGDRFERAHANPLLNDPALQDPDLLPGPRNVADIDGPEGQPGMGYLWSSAIRAHRDVRNYGFFIDLTRYDSSLEADHKDALIQPIRFAFQSRTVISYPTHEQLIGKTDPYFHGFDTRVPDYYRYKEWQREFDVFEQKHTLPALSLVRFMMDHTGSFKETLDDVNTPELQIADNDYALGLLIERVAHSQYAKDTIIVVTEDDAQDGPDHVDSHRSPAFIIGPYTQLNGKVVSNKVTTVNLIKTIEMLLQLKPNNSKDQLAKPILEVFDIHRRDWNYQAEPSALLRLTKLPLPTSTAELRDNQKPLHDVTWWSLHTQGFDFSAEDRLDADLYNHILWNGTMGEQTYPDRP